MSRIQKVIESNKGLAFHDPDVLYVINYYRIIKHSYFNSDRWFLKKSYYSENIVTYVVDFRSSTGKFTASAFNKTRFNNLLDFMLSVVTHEKSPSKRTKR